MKHNFKKSLAAIFLATVLLLLFGRQTQGQNINTIAGNGTAGYNGDNQAATVAELSTPGDVAVDDSGNVYISDEVNQRIRKVIASTGIIITIAGNGTPGYMGDNGAATAAEINTPYGIAIDDSGNVYFADGSNQVVRKIATSTGIITTVAGNNALGAGYNGDNIAATAAELYQPSGIAIDDSGNIFIADFRNQRIREVRAATKIITTIAGNGTMGFAGDGSAATSAEIWYPGGVALDDSDNVYIADAANDRIRKVSAKTRIISTIAGNGVNAPNSGAYSGDNGPAIDASMFWCVRLAVDDSANVIICDEYNERIRKVTAATGIITTIAGTGFGQGSLNGGYNGDNIPATSAELWAPGGVAVDNCGNVYIADDYNERVREVASSGTHSISVSPDSLSICSGGSDTLKASGAGTYTWSPATGLSTTTGSEVIVNPTITTTYTITGGNSACAAIKTVVVTVTSAPPLNILPLDTSFCSGQSATLYVSGGGSDFIWKPTVGLRDSTATGDSVLASPTSTTTYSVTGINPGGCASDGSDIVTIVPSPNKPKFMQVGDTLMSSSQHDNQWYRNDTLLINDTSQNLTITIPGEYWVIVNNEANGCSTSSDSANVKLAGIGQINNITNQLSIYPNPFSNNVFININSSGGDIKDWNLQITDVLGRTVYNKSSLNYNNDIDLSSLENGVYFITAINKTGKTVVPVIKQ